MAAELWGAGLEVAAPEFRPGNLATKFLQPPFTVLDTRKGDWQERRRSWLSLGIQSELGRSGQLISHATEREGYGADYDTSKGENAWGGSGTSIFDPVLCELAYRWWAPEGGLVLDPFAGGSVRGIVAAKLGHPYTGIDLSGPQVAANRAQAAAILGPGEPVPTWLQGDSSRLEELLPPGQLYDMVWSCPPYFDLEVYSDDPADLSTMEWPAFLMAYDLIVEAACRRLRPGHFAAFVVSEVRDPTGAYRGLVPYTIHAFQRAGLRYYNEAVLVNSAGSLPLRVTKYMEASRKLGRAHQNVLVFVKGEPPRGWSYDRAAPPSPQLDLHLLEPEPAPELAAAPDLAPPQPAPGRPAEEPPAPVPSGASADPPRHRALSVPSPELTPVERRGAVWVKRDDLFEAAGVRGGKVRTCWALAQGATGLVTAGSRSSPQANIVAHVAQALGIGCRVHTPTGALSPELLDAQAAGAEVVQHQAGYNSVIIARAREDAAARPGWCEIPFGMECQEAVEATAGQVANVPADVGRIVVPVGSGMSLAGILHGLERARRTGVHVVGVVVGADPAKRLDRWAPAGWRERVELVPSGSDYHEPAAATHLLGLELDAHYEAKAAPFLAPDDLLWLVGIRATQAPPALEPEPELEEESAEWVADVEGMPQELGEPPEVTWASPTDGYLPGAGTTAPVVRLEQELEAWVEGPEPGQVHNPATGEVREWDRATWRADDPDRRCFTCGAPPSHANVDGSPAYSCPSHPAIYVQEALLP